MLVNSKNEQEFTISPSVRVVANYSDDHEGIDEVIANMGLAIHTLRVARNFREYKTETEFTDELTEIVDDETLIEDSVTDYFTSEQVPFVIYHLKGFSQGEWHDVVIYDPKKSWTPEQLEGIGNYVDAIFSGEVYDVKVQQAKVYTAKDGSEVVEWLDSNEYFPETVTEKLFILKAEYIYDTFGLEVIPEVEG